MINQFDEHDWHNQGDLFFGADGFLYVGMGDEGGLDNAYGNAQKRDGGLFSGVLRLDVNQDPARSHPIRRQPQAGGVVPPGWPATFSQGYGIPRDNPWLDAGGGLLEEFWAIGLRNPYRMSLDSVTGTVFIGDVGQTGMEEINVLTKGANFQWSFKEGTAPGPDAQPSPLVGTNTPTLSCVCTNGWQSVRDRRACLPWDRTFGGLRWAVCVWGLHVRAYLGNAMAGAGHARGEAGGEHDWLYFGWVWVGSPSGDLCDEPELQWSHFEAQHPPSAPPSSDPISHRSL